MTPDRDEENEMFKALIDSASDAIISTDAQGRVLSFNRAAERIFGRSRQAMLGQSIEVLLPERFQTAHKAHRQGFAKAHEATRMMGLGLVKGQRVDGQELDLEGTISQLMVNGQQLLFASLRDVTERMRSEAQRQQSRTQLSELTQKLMSQEKTLVKRMVQTLHDQLGQTMAAIRMVHETMVVLQKDKVSAEVNRLDQQLGALIHQAVRQVRQVLLDLHPPLLEEQGLAAALDNELRNRALTQAQTQIDFNVGPTVAALRWPAEVEFAAFMIGREAVENALRHSGASVVTVGLTGTALMMRLEVMDNGKGFSSAASSPAGHLGIAGMHERAKAVGATLRVGPGEGNGGGGGTCMSLSWQPAP